MYKPHCTLKGKYTISKNYAKVDLHTIKNKNVKYFFKIIFLDHSSNISFFPLGVGHGVQREGKECEELVMTAKRWQLECREEVNVVSIGGKRKTRRRGDDFFLNL